MVFVNRINFIGSFLDLDICNRIARYELDLNKSLENQEIRIVKDYLKVSGQWGRLECPIKLDSK
jgi:hypothetical protein